MRDSLIERLRRRPARAAVAGLLLALTGWYLATQLTGWADLAVFSVRVRQLERRADGGALTTLTLAFPYRGETRRMRVTVSSAYLAAARAVPTSAVFRSDGRLQSAHVASLVQIESESRFIGDLAREIRGLRDELGLDPDEYVELMSRVVQSIPYGTPSWQIGLPVSVVADDRGVCSDKSVLLASLLLHEEYDTAVWIFETQRHAAVGVRGVGRGFGGTPYSLIETTREAFVGEYDDDLLALATYVRSPQIIQVGGRLLYRADIESSYIADELRRSRASSVALAPYQAYAARAEDPWRSTYAALAEEHDTATRRAEWIRANADDRALVFVTLTETGSPR